jgi:NAD(P)H-nitrite reductase large subunit
LFSCPDRIGNSKHQLLAIWEELGSVSLEYDHTYTQRLHIVKFCVISRW